MTGAHFLARLAPCLLALAAPLAAAPLLAQDAASTPHQAEVQAAQLLGAQLYAYDQVAWHGTDAFMADVQREGLDTSWLRGFLVLPDAAGALWMVFYGDREGVLVEAARYRVEGAEVKEGGLLEGAAQVPLSATAQTMARLRQESFAEMGRQQYGLCARANPNTVVLPPDANGAIAVYVLTAPTTNENYPLGGHYRFTYGADGALLSHRRFLNSCFAVPLQMPDGGAPEGSRPVGIFVSHLLDEYPTEIHFFVSHNVPLDLMVGTLNSDTMWNLQAGTLTGAEPIPQHMRQP